MKKILLLASAFVFSFAIMAQNNYDSLIKVNTDKYDFGKIKQGVPVTYSFEIKNISSKILVVENTWASCGCTTPEKITEPIQPGATAKLKVQYSAAGMGTFTKDVYIKLAGMDQPKAIQITGEQLAADAYDTWVKEKDSKSKSKDSKDNKPNN